MSAPVALPDVPALFGGGLVAAEYLGRLKAWVEYLESVTNGGAFGAITATSVNGVLIGIGGIDLDGGAGGALAWGGNGNTIMLDSSSGTITISSAGNTNILLPTAGTVLANNPGARTATADGLTTGTIPDAVTFVTVTSDDANKIIILPEPVVGREVVIDVGATGFELRSSDPATIAINGGSGADAESAIPADSTVFLRCISLTAWKGFYLDADGDVVKVEAAAA